MLKDFPLVMVGNAVIFDFPGMVGKGDAVPI